MRAMLLLLTATVIAASTASSAVYVVSDGYKIAPDGGVVEFGRKGPGKLKDGNAIWNAGSSTVHVAAARNEVVAFQIVIPGPAAGIRVSCDGLVGPAKLPPGSVSFHLIGYVKYGKAWHPDVAVPLTWPGAAPFSIPYTLPGLAEAPDQKVGVVLGEVAAPADAKAGDYRGVVKIAGGATATLKLRLKVWPFAMPARPSIVFDFNSYSSPVSVVAKDNRNPYAPTAGETIAAEHEFYRCAARHRAFLNIMPVHSQRGKPYYTPALSGRGAAVKADWTHWDKRFAPVLDGTIFDDKQPPPYFYLPHNLHWPYGYSHDAAAKDQRLNFLPRKEYRTDHTLLIKQHGDYLPEWEALGKQYVEHLAAKGWTRPVFQVYLNHSTGRGKSHSYSAWRLDEPYDRWGFQVLKYYADLTHRVFRNTRGVKVRYRLDIGHFYCRTPNVRCYKAKKYDLPLEQGGGGPALLEPSVDLWYIGTIHTFGNRQQVARVGALDADKEMFMYGGGQSVANGGTMHRSLLWYMWHFGQRGYCAWNQGCCDPKPPLRSAGGSHVWYSGAGLGFKGPAPSLRMKLWRRSSYDVEYLRLAEQRSSRAKVLEIFAKLCPYKKTHSRYEWTPLPYPVNNPEDFELARLKLASVILGRDIAGARKFKGPVAGPPNETVDQITDY